MLERSLDNERFKDRSYQQRFAHDLQTSRPRCWREAGDGNQHSDCDELEKQGTLQKAEKSLNKNRSFGGSGQHNILVERNAMELAKTYLFVN
jgi:hypothetical protein